MAAPKLTEDQRTQLLEWLAAGYSEGLIRQWFQEHEWPEIAQPAMSYYRKRFKAQIEALRTERHAAALNTGLALKAERVERLKAHADRLEAIKWTPDKNGRLWNEAAWRETLDDIAKEMGHRRTGIDIAAQEIEVFLDAIRDAFPEEYPRLLALAAGLTAAK